MFATDMSIFNLFIDNCNHTINNIVYLATFNEDQWSYTLLSLPITAYKLKPKTTLRYSYLSLHTYTRIPPTHTYLGWFKCLQISPSKHPPDNSNLTPRPPQYDARKLERLTWKKLYARDGYITPAELKPSDDWNTTALTIKSAHRAVIYQESNSHQNNPLMLLGHQKLFQYIYYKLRTYKLINMLNMRIDSLDIGTFNDLLSVTLQTSFNEVIATFSEAAITTLPVTNSYG